MKLEVVLGGLGDLGVQSDVALLALYDMNVFASFTWFNPRDLTGENPATWADEVLVCDQLKSLDVTLNKQPVSRAELMKVIDVQFAHTD